MHISYLCYIEIPTSYISPCMIRKINYINNTMQLIHYITNEYIIA